jgi:phospho-N-acetylmuramoyl-pentapeptide-transferase
MLLFLAEWLSKYVGAFRVFEYVSFRALSSCLVALIFSIIIGKAVINWLLSIKIGQMIRDDGPQSHLAKAGTPTMGGVLIIISVTLTVLLFADLTNSYIWLLLFVLISTGAIGFMDDYKKIVFKNSKGVSARAKLLLQTMITAIVVIVLLVVIKIPNSTELVIPFSKSVSIPLNFIGFLVLTFFVIVGSSNAVNLTDGLDGLVSFPIIAASIGLAVFAYIAGNKFFANYLLLPHVPGSHEIVVFCGALIGSCLGFLWFNAHPAKVFMGDVGSLAIGATLGTIAIIVRQEIAFAIMGGLFVCEALSVIIQVASYKMTKKRVFLMAPLHHHFELKGWKENQVVVRFWIISIILLLFSLSTIKLR